jgi:hypothetical protein
MEFSLAVQTRLIFAHIARFIVWANRILRTPEFAQISGMPGYAAFAKFVFTLYDTSGSGHF